MNCIEANQSTTHGTKRDVVSQNAERYSISGGSPQSGFGYMTTVSSTTNMNNVYQRANPIKSSTKVLGVRFIGTITFATLPKKYNENGES
jgi:hypothetical protein